MYRDKQLGLLTDNGFQESDWAKKGETEWARRKVFTEFSKWAAGLKNSRLVEKAGQLWQVLQEGGLSRTDMAIVIGALLYCISPIDLIPDAIPVLGYVDDLLAALTVLSYLKKKNAQQ